MAKELEEQLVANVPERVIEAQTEIYELLGVVPVGFDYLSAVVTLLSSELAGFYDPVARRMVIAEDLEGEPYRVTLSHELVHALQDQHWDLASLLRHEDDASDRKAALHAIAEGDAMSLMLDELYEELDRTALDMPLDALGTLMRQQMESSMVSGAVPAILLRTVVAPYEDGIRFVHAMRNDGGWSAVDDAWNHPPASTEQLLHPQKYRAGDPPLEVAVPESPAGEGWTLRYRDVVGEQAIALLLEEWVERDDARHAAEGWAGDRIATYHREDGAFAFAWTIVWDREEQAERGFHALAPSRGARGGSAKTATQRCVERSDAGPMAVSRDGRRVTVVAGPVVRNGRALVADSSCNSARAWAARLQH